MLRTFDGVREKRINWPFDSIIFSGRDTLPAIDFYRPCMLSDLAPSSMVSSGKNIFNDYLIFISKNPLKRAMCEDFA